MTIRRIDEWRAARGKSDDAKGAAGFLTPGREVEVEAESRPDSQEDQALR
jgi:hypothetical protein